MHFHPLRLVLFPSLSSLFKKQADRQTNDTLTFCEEDNPPQTSTVSIHVSIFKGKHQSSFSAVSLPFAITSQFIMKLTSLISFLCLVNVNSLAFQSPGKSSSVDRRNAIIGVAATTASLLSSSSPALAASGAEAFVGTFSDPINHPGGKRTIRLLDQTVGDYQLAEVLGGGGVGEPKNYVLPAAVIGDRTIVIDFSPKGGPRDFVGVLDKGDIKFLRDGNRWPRLKEE